MTGMSMIENVEIRLPKTEEAVRNYFSSCTNRRKYVTDAKEHYKKRLKKAKHDLKCAIDECGSKNWDWTIVKAYYAIHHAANALLSKKKGLFSKDHSCLIVALKQNKLIDDKLFNELTNVYEGFSDTLSIGLTFELRKIGQYDVDRWEELTEDDAKRVLETAKTFVSYVEGSLE
jgi:uncharacterized protein (UPF0332 family)